jgi:hypothetical protein
MVFVLNLTTPSSFASARTCLVVGVQRDASSQKIKVTSYTLFPTERLSERGFPGEFGKLLTSTVLSSSMDEIVACVASLRISDSRLAIIES